MSAGPTPAGQSEPQVSRDLSLLAPLFRAAVEAALADCAADGLDAYVYEAMRSHELALNYAARVPKVTNAPDETYSWHGYGLAVDVISRARQWNQPESWYAKVADHFKTHGCKWGGDWRMHDLPHMQWGACKPSPSAEARRILAAEGMAAVWTAVGAL